MEIMSIEVKSTEKKLKVIECTYTSGVHFRHDDYQRVITITEYVSKDEDGRMYICVQTEHGDPHDFADQVQTIREFSLPILVDGVHCDANDEEQRNRVIDHFKAHPYSINQ